MASHKSTSRTRPVKKSRPATEPAASTIRKRRVVSQALDDAIEAERGSLMKADAVLNCLALAMDYDDGANITRPYYAIIVELARDLVSDSITRLEAVNLEAAVRARRASGKKAGDARMGQDSD